MTIENIGPNKLPSLRYHSWIVVLVVYSVSIQLLSASRHFHFLASASFYWPIFRFKVFFLLFFFFFATLAMSRQGEASKNKKSESNLFAAWLWVVMCFPPVKSSTGWSSQQTPPLVNRSIGCRTELASSSPFGRPKMAAKLFENPPKY